MVLIKSAIGLLIAPCLIYSLLQMLIITWIFVMWEADHSGHLHEEPLREDSSYEHLRMAHTSEHWQHITSKLVGIDIKGNLTGTRFAIYSGSLQVGISEKYKYAYSLPLTAMAWRRIGYSSIVILVGSENEWISDSVAYHIYLTLLQQNVAVVFIDIELHHQTVISQVSRVFVPAILGYLRIVHRHVYIITSDADIWPLEKSIYELPKGADILSLNADCCDVFKHRRQRYKMLPMANIGMSAAHWIDVISQNNSVPIPNSAQEMLSYMQLHFGSGVNKMVSKGTFEWYMDQRLISILLQSSVIKRDKTVKYVPRNTNLDRIDRNVWRPREFNGKVDAHILNNPYSKDSWAQIWPLIELLYYRKSDQTWVRDYHDSFVELADKYLAVV